MHEGQPLDFQKTYSSNSPTKPTPPKSGGVSFSTRQSEKNYLDYYDKVHKKSELNKPKQSANVGFKCLTGFVTGQCSNGHLRTMPVVCGKEWCGCCGEKNSAIHKRRVARWWDKVHQMKTLGYFVVTIPKHVRPLFKDVAVLQDFRKYLIRRLKRDGYTRGMSRWHWAGDCKECEGDGCEKCDWTGSGHEWNPHLNFFIEDGHIPMEYINKLRRDCKRWMQNAFGINLKHDTTIWYGYATDEKHKTHKLVYMTRATWRWPKNISIVLLIKGFKTSQPWGKWDKSEVKGDSALVSLVKGNCDCCGTRIEWGTFKSIKEFNELYKINREIDGGYFEVDKKPPKRQALRQLKYHLQLSIV